MSDEGTGALGGRLKLIRQESTDRLGFDLLLDRSIHKIADPTLDDNAPLKTVRLFEIHVALEQICVYPVSTLPTTRFLTPKYKRIRSICVDYGGAGVDLSETLDAISFLRDYLPQGFIKDPSFGLGLIKETRPIITAIEDIAGVNNLVISSDEKTRVDGNTYYLNGADYEELRLAFHRIAIGYQGESLSDRTLLAHNELLHTILPERFPAKERPYKPGTVFKLLGGRAAGTIKLRGKDRKSAVAVVTTNAKDIEKNDPREFAQLQKDIELVSLDKLLEQFQRALARNRVESEWQHLFELNPFILSMVFGYPIVIVQPSASTGGITLQGSGNKIADFLVKNASTHNAALVEIKKPNTKLLGREYRDGVWTLSQEMSGGIVQVLDQRQKLCANIAQLRYNSRVSDLDVVVVDCVIVAGRTPSEPAEIASFELMRNQLKDVRVVTFDELLQKLVLLREMLSGERYEAPPLEEEDEESLLGPDVIEDFHLDDDDPSDDMDQLKE